MSSRLASTSSVKAVSTLSFTADMQGSSDLLVLDADFSTHSAVADKDASTLSDDDLLIAASLCFDEMDDDHPTTDSSALENFKNKLLVLELGLASFTLEAIFQEELAASCPHPFIIQAKHAFMWDGKNFRHPTPITAEDMHLRIKQLEGDANPVKMTSSYPLPTAARPSASTYTVPPQTNNRPRREAAKHRKTLDDYCSGEDFSEDDPESPSMLAPRTTSSCHGLLHNTMATGTNRDNTATAPMTLGGLDNPSSWTIEVIKPYFNMRITDAAPKLGVGLTNFKKICRGLGIGRWPKRKLDSVANLEDSLKTMSPNEERNEDTISKGWEVCKQMQSNLFEDPSHKFDEKFTMLRQQCFKVKYKVKKSKESKKKTVGRRPIYR
jgi:hypothetical protein